jgi:hypothetical protein
MIASHCLMQLFQGKNSPEAEAGGVLLAELLSIGRAYYAANKKK